MHSILASLVADRAKDKEEFTEQTAQAVLAIAEILVLDKSIEPEAAFLIAQNLVLNALNFVKTFKLPGDEPRITLATQIPKV